MANLSIRGVDESVLATLKSMASQQGVSVNALVLRLIDQGVGRVPGKPALRRFDDLDALAGAWSEEEAAEFAANVEGCERIEPELWQ